MGHLNERSRAQLPQRLLAGAAAALKMTIALCGWPLRRAKPATEWLSHEVTGPAKKRRSGVAWTVAAVAILVGTGNRSLLLIAGSTDMPSLVTAFLTDVTAGVTLWVVVRPKIQQVNWPVVRTALIFGVSSAVSIWSGQEALHHMSFAMYGVLALIVGPTTAALVSGRRHWHIISWVVVSVTGAFLLFGVQAWHLSPMGAVSVFLNGAMYWVMVWTFTNLGRKEKGDGKEAVFLVSALSKLFTVPILGVLFLVANGPTVVSQHTVWATVGALSVGALATITAVCNSVAWKRGLTASAHAQLQPTKPVLALMWGMLAGQKPSNVGLNTIAGYILVCLGAGAVGRLFVEIKKKQDEPDRNGFIQAA